ncbi:MAG: hypothetical protein JWM04_1540 [Verrucomicrobiales bacterium]|nr:hypothetical protein [Verrucomicrobiales bacterium]
MDSSSVRFVSKFTIPFVGALLLLGGCKQPADVETSAAPGRYQVVNAPRHEGEPWIFRVDTTSGKTWVLDTLSTNGLNWLLIPGSDERELKH